MLNPTTLIDGYKLDHRRQYPKGTTRVYSNFTPRGSRVAGQEEVVASGLQGAIQKYLVDALEPFFRGDVEQWVAKYEKRVNGYLGPNSIGTDHIRAWHALGYTPLEFRAVPEGSRVGLRVPMFTVENTHPDFFWLTNYYETLLSSVIWQPCTSATSALRLRKLLNSWAVRTGSPLEFVPWQGHDFSFRGMPGPEAAAFSGMAHLLFFTGTDTIPAIDLIEEYYGVPDGYLIAGSVAATEHSVMSAGGKEDEAQTYERLIELYPTGIVSIVSDTWDLWKVLTETLPALKDRILSRDGKIVVRPDSGDPVKIICGDPDAPEGSPARAGVIELLWNVFGGTTTVTGHRFLDSHIGCIYGDAISYERADAIMAGLAAKGFASANMVLGVGSFSYQFVTRDTYNFAVKATWTERDGQGYSMFKQPATDNGVKNSARGRIAVIGGRLIDDATAEQEAASELVPIWRDGRWMLRDTFDVVRARAQENI